MDYLSLFSSMLRSRYFEKELEKLANDGLIYGTYHLSIGQEAVAAGLSAALSDDDWIVPTHRCHAFNVCRHSNLEAMFSEVLGSRYGLCKGLGGSMHMTDVENCNLGSSAVVGSGIGLAAGIALSKKLKREDGIAVAIFGDGASSRGILYEVMNIASLWHLPLLFLLENNQYGMSAASNRMIASDGIHKRAEGFLIPHEAIDGNDVLAVEEAVATAKERIKADGKPYFLEAVTYRQCGHSRSDHLVYRTREEENEWQKRDPIELLSAFLLLSGIADKEKLAELKRKAAEEVRNAAESALRHKDELLSVSEAESLVYAPAVQRSTESGKMHRGSYREAIREALDEILSSDSSAFLLGEDIGCYGGCFGVTGDLYKRHSGRVLETPVSEEGFTSMAVGAAAMSLHPIVELMYGDFSTLASDPLINHAAKLRFMSGGQLSCPLVLRTPVGGLTGHGAQHTQSLETMFLSIPGLKIVAPSDPLSAKALLKSAAEDGNPVIFFEHKALYGQEGEIGDSGFSLPLGKAIVHGGGERLAVIGYSRAFAAAFSSLSYLSTQITFVDLATLKPLDEETVLEVYSKTRKVLIVQDTPLAGSIGEHICALLSSQSCFNPGSVVVLSALDMPLPPPRKLEEDVLVSAFKIREAAEGLLAL
ncbi:MAG: pyruvate dehydrogenase [Spirochaetes bacterium]|uniref:Pyruvate dehydrogenase n=1 Tax=Candidatus Ornithospirochaeta stercoripullorum TaxID=2840899 RepID=A0A9D9E1N9_9SPIO|nr:pyruvate dehydrogenase [Candidatus Ornithospirochaeta stercoripullorum]